MSISSEVDVARTRPRATATLARSNVIVTFSLAIPDVLPLGSIRRQPPWPEAVRPDSLRSSCCCAAGSRAIVDLVSRLLDDGFSGERSCSATGRGTALAGHSGGRRGARGGRGADPGRTG